LASTALAVAVGGACSPPTASSLDGARPALRVDIGAGRRLNFRCIGAGSPTVVFESGWGASSLAWVRVQGLVAATHRACAYDRAGYGFSDPGPLPRDADAIVSDLAAGLKAARLPGPYILVGHSAGGLYVRRFAELHPADVAGLVLADPSVEHQDRRFAEVFGPGAGSVQSLLDRSKRCLQAARAGSLPPPAAALDHCTPKPNPLDAPASFQERLAEARRPSQWITEISELETLFSSTSDEVGGAGLGAIPLVVLTGANSQGSSGSNSPAEALWAQMHREVASLSSRGSARLVDRSTHMMMFDRPDAIAAAIEDVAQTARASGAPGKPGQ
jgi:pimeloyl-ACP methyl ester carboxylesterase